MSTILHISSYSIIHWLQEALKLLTIHDAANDRDGGVSEMYVHTQYFTKETSASREKDVIGDTIIIPFSSRKGIRIPEWEYNAVS